MHAERLAGLRLRALATASRAQSERLGAARKNVRTSTYGVKDLSAQRMRDTNDVDAGTLGKIVARNADALSFVWFEVECRAKVRVTFARFVVFADEQHVGVEALSLVGENHVIHGRSSISIIDRTVSRHVVWYLTNAHVAVRHCSSFVRMISSIFRQPVGLTTHHLSS